MKTTETRLQKLEAQAAPQGHCPHLHQVVKMLAPDGSDSIENEFPKTCECGQAIELFEIKIVAAIAADVAKARENQ